MSKSLERTHIVLIPGFAGFDALGQISYYFGVTEKFNQWHQQFNGSKRAVLHYFDNFPTAGVAIRAQRLQSFLAERIARGDFVPGVDEVVLIGHSTGGLDIRRLLWNLQEKQANQESIWTDGVEIPARSLLQVISRLVFISVPQFGTNLANQLRMLSLLHWLFVAKLRDAVAVSQVPIVDSIQQILATSASRSLDIDFVLAANDALSECEPKWLRGKIENARAEECTNELDLWLRHLSSDYSFVDDLAMQRPKKDAVSPAHFTAEMRAEEISKWRQNDISARSYITVTDAPENLLEPNRTDAMFRSCYGACSLNVPQNIIPSSNVAIQSFGNWVAPAARQITLDQNDGIVNTASMLWPNDAEVFLVKCDHMDVVGHYKRIAAPKEIRDQGREFIAYDLLNSYPTFSDENFKAVWQHIFNYCCDVKEETPNLSAVLVSV